MNNFTRRSLLKSSFSAQAEHYDRQTEWRHDENILETIGEVAGAGAGRVADLGTGTGIVGERLVSLGWDVIGLDFSTGMIHQARKRLSQVVLADVCSLPVSRQILSGCSMRQIMHYVNDRALLAEARRVVESRGWIVSADVVVDQKTRPIWSEIKSIVQPMRRRVYTADEHMEIFRLSGWSIQQVKTVSVRRSDRWSVFFRRVLGNQKKIDIVFKLLGHLADLSSLPELHLDEEGMSYLQEWQVVRAIRA